MKKLFIIAAVCGLASCLWIHQRLLLHDVRIRNQRLAAVVAELKERATRAETARQSAERQLADLRRQSGSHVGAASDLAAHEPGLDLTPPVEPDPMRQGGWPQKAAFFYLPKQYLTNVSYQLLKGNRLTDEAAALFGMSAAERELTDKAFDDLVDQFRRAQIQRMEQAPPPAGWMIGADSPAPHAVIFDSALTYHIPDLTDDINSARTSFSDQLQQTLGPSRAQIIASAADSFFSQNMDDLGAGEHTVGFAWASESDGTQSLWYAVADARHGEGAFERVEANLDPNSQIAYYARLFGVPLPAQ
jgi:hypothetical protein